MLVPVVATLLGTMAGQVAGPGGRGIGTAPLHGSAGLSWGDWLDHRRVETRLTPAGDPPDRISRLDVLSAEVKTLKKTVAALEDRAKWSAGRIAELEKKAAENLASDKWQYDRIGELKQAVAAQQSHVHYVQFPNVTATCYDGLCNVVSVPAADFTGPPKVP